VAGGAADASVDVPFVFDGETDRVGMYTVKVILGLNVVTTESVFGDPG
jgi:hypothetical protein